MLQNVCADGFAMFNRIEEGSVYAALLGGSSAVTVNPAGMSEPGPVLDWIISKPWTSEEIPDLFYVSTGAVSKYRRLYGGIRVSFLNGGRFELFDEYGNSSGAAQAITGRISGGLSIQSRNDIISAGINGGFEYSGFSSGKNIRTPVGGSVLIKPHRAVILYFGTGEITFHDAHPVFQTGAAVLPGKAVTVCTGVEYVLYGSPIVSLALQLRFARIISAAAGWEAGGHGSLTPGSTINSYDVMSGYHFFHRINASVGITPGKFTVFYRIGIHNELGLTHSILLQTHTNGRSTKI